MAEEGVCKIKPEFVIPEHIRQLNLSCVSDKDKEKLADDSQDSDKCAEPCLKKTKYEDKKLRGQNKRRKATFKRDVSMELCNTLINIQDGDEIKECQKARCDFLHDIDEYLKNKPEDIGAVCHNFTTFGKCSRGLTCRFSKQHTTENGRCIANEQNGTTTKHTINQLPFELQLALRKRKYDFTMAEALIKYNDRLYRKNHKEDDEGAKGAITDEDIVTFTKREKKTIDFRNKLCLSPLTTVGNLPFRRICKEYGADVTCGEMAMCSSLLQGAPQEWALVKRHHTEDIFGVQLCGNNPHVLTRCAQLLDKEVQIDFIDLNLGCPIELVYQQGGGSGLLRRQNVLEHCVRNMSQILSIPLTVKTRMGVYKDCNIAHTLMPKFREWGASLVTVHGRSREQRYTRKANWDYIRQCVQEASPLPVFGNGDVLSYQDYKAAMDSCPELAGVMIGRGALIKPWIFKEIKEQKLWDITSKERFEILQKYTNYGLEHWGSDTKGVENTRRFMLEWLSFLHRYIPVGLLEQPPQKINERPPFYKGRDDLETLMASTSAADWVKISEMLLGKVPDNFQFLPKHKANSYQ